MIEKYIQDYKPLVKWDDWVIKIVSQLPQGGS